jgi:hypothetical protein
MCNTKKTSPNLVPNQNKGKARPTPWPRQTCIFWAPRRAYDRHTSWCMQFAYARLRICEDSRISIMVLYDIMLTLLWFVCHVTVPGYSHLTGSLGRQYCNTPRRDMILSSVSYQPKKESATHFTRKIVWHWHWTLALAARVVLQYSRIESMC